MSCPSTRWVRHIDAVLVLAALVGAGSARAQQQLPTAPTKIWVSNIHGNDANPGTSGSPFQTITHALSVASTGPGFTTIMVMPGVYDENNGETMPLVMKRNVSMQGAGAVETVLRGVNDCGADNIVVLFRAASAADFDHVYIDGFTITHAASLPL